MQRPVAATREAPARSAKNDLDPIRRQLELAFYSLLLEPLRARQVAPAGELILRRDGASERVRSSSEMSTSPRSAT
ncbi:MAG: hypothetical protein ACREQM_22730 [Candidatus Dormibacteraceae bacterium]